MTVDGIDSRLIGQPPIGTVRPVGPGSAQRPQGAPADSGFDEILRQQLAKGELKFSAHAQARIAARRMSLGQEELTRLSVGVDRAAAKGARESLVLMDDKAFVVSVRNRTVITAVDGDHMKENVFTNIDSAVIV